MNGNNTILAVPIPAALAEELERRARLFATTPERLARLAIERHFPVDGDVLIVSPDACGPTEAPGADPGPRRERGVRVFFGGDQSVEDWQGHVAAALVARLAIARIPTP